MSASHSDAGNGLEGTAVSPELVLVDPVLRGAALAALGKSDADPPPAVTSTRRASPLARRRRPRGSAPRDRGPLPYDRRASLPSMCAVAVAVAVALTLTRQSPADGPILLDEGPSATPTLGFTRIRPTPPSHAGSELAGPESGAALRWEPAAGASYYNVQVFRDGHLVFEAWPARPEVTLPRAWQHRERSERLDPGVYHAYVWPGIGRPEEAKYGPLLGEWTLAVPK